jgi:uncharacterized glyoxalase superfamily protein PhnB
MGHVSSYEEGRLALDWLAQTFGFVEVTRWLDDAGRLSHGEMSSGSGQIMLATPTPTYQSPKHHRKQCPAADVWSQAPWMTNGVLVYVDDVEAHYQRAKAGGATILPKPKESSPGKRYRAEDLEGQRWMFMER